MKGPILHKVTHKGQKYVDDAIYIHPKKKTTIERSLQIAWNPTEREQAPILVGFERVILQWHSESSKTAT